MPFGINLNPINYFTRSKTNPNPSNNSSDLDKKIQKVHEQIRMEDREFKNLTLPVERLGYPSVVATLLALTYGTVATIAGTAWLFSKRLHSVKATKMKNAIVALTAALIGWSIAKIFQNLMASINAPPQNNNG